MADEKRLIDANALLYEYCQANGCNEVIDEVCPNCFTAGLIANAPTVDAVEVIHAEWLDIRFDSMWKSMLATCSHCKVRGEVRVKSNECGFAVPDSDYCPSCGAKMYGGINK